MNDETKQLLITATAVVGVITTLLITVRGCARESYESRFKRESTERTQMLEGGYEFKLVPGVQGPVWTKKEAK